MKVLVFGSLNIDYVYRFMSLHPAAPCPAADRGWCPARTAEWSPRRVQEKH